MPGFWDIRPGGGSLSRSIHTNIWRIAQAAGGSGWCVVGHTDFTRNATKSYVEEDRAIESAARVDGELQGETKKTDATHTDTADTN